MLSCAAFIFQSVSPALAVDAQELKVSRVGDLYMGCGALSREATLMRDIIFTTQDIKNNREMESMGISAAGAIGSLLIGTATGGVGLAAAGFMLDRNAENGLEKADSVQDTAEQRRTFVMGIYNAKGCYGPIEHAMASPDEYEPLDQMVAIEPASGESTETAGNDYND